MSRKTAKSEDEMLPEYDLDSVPVLGRGPDFIRRQQQAYRRARRNPRVIVELEPDVATHFPDSAAVNEALRLLIKSQPRRRKTVTR